MRLSHPYASMTWIRFEWSPRGSVASQFPAGTPIGLRDFSTPGSSPVKENCGIEILLLSEQPNNEREKQLEIRRQLIDPELLVRLGTTMSGSSKRSRSADAWPVATISLRSRPGNHPTGIHQSIAARK